jgi:hypothetical protein
MRNVDPKRYQDAQDKTNREAVRVAAIVEVISFDPGKMRVTVKPLSKYLDGGEYKSQPQILDVPVGYTKSGGFIIRPWFKKGDIGNVVYLDHDIDRVAETGQECKPNTERNHSTSDAVFIGAIVPGNKPMSGIPDEAVVISNDAASTYIAVMQDSIEIISSGNISMTASDDVSIVGARIDLN